MTGPIVQQLGQLTRELDVTVGQLEQAEKEAVDKRHEADLAEAKSFLRADGSVDARKRLALVECERVEHEAMVAEAVVRHLKRRLSALGTRIDTGRTFASAAKAEMALSSASGTP